MSDSLFDVRERARREALRLVGSVLDTMGDDAPAALVDAHRVLATGCTDEDRSDWPAASQEASR